jgi:hypothetical protein
MHIHLFLQAWKARHVLQNLKNPYIIYADKSSLFLLNAACLAEKQKIQFL